MRMLFQFLEDNPFTGIAALAITAITIIEIVSIIVLHKLVAVSFLRELLL